MAASGVSGQRLTTIRSTRPQPRPMRNALSYDATTGQYTYVWKSAKTWAGTCGDLVIRLADGSEYSARFQFKK